jgi:hypothetical protein
LQASIPALLRNYRERPALQMIVQDSCKVLPDAHPEMTPLPDIGLREKLYPRNINPMPPVKFFVRLDRIQICLFLDAHYRLIYFQKTLDPPPRRKRGRNTGTSQNPDRHGAVRVRHARKPDDAGVKRWRLRIQVNPSWLYCQHLLPWRSVFSGRRSLESRKRAKKTVTQVERLSSLPQLQGRFRRAIVDYA